MFYLWVGFNSRWGSIISIFIFDWGFIHIYMGWGYNQEWDFNGADKVLKNQFEFTQIVHCAEKCAMPRCLSLHINLHDLLRQNHGSLISLQLFLAYCYIVQV